MMATTETEMPEKMMMSRSVRVRVAWHSRKLSFESWVRDTRLPSMGREHSMPSTPALKQEIRLDGFTRLLDQSCTDQCHIYGHLDKCMHLAERRTSRQNSSASVLRRIHTVQMKLIRYLIDSEDLKLMVMQICE